MVQGMGSPVVLDMCNTSVGLGLQLNHFNRKKLNQKRRPLECIPSPMFKITMTKSFEDAATEIAKAAVKDAVAMLAKQYHFDPVEAEAFVMGGGVQVKSEVLPRQALPWCGQIVEENCEALNNSTLFTQCHQKKKNGRWCTKCDKYVAEHGAPKNGDVHQRNAIDVMDFTSGGRRVSPFGDVMKRYKYTREQVEESAAFYGWTVDPRQYELKKRGRPSNPMELVTPTVPLPAPEPEPEPAPAPAPEPEPEPERPRLPEPAPSLPATVSVSEEPAARDSVSELEELEEGELEEEEVKLTAKEIDAMPIAELRKVAETKGIPTKEGGKNIGVAALRTTLKGHFA